MKLRIKSISDTICIDIVLRANPGTLITDLKKQIHSQVGVPEDEQVLFIQRDGNEEILQDTRCVFNYFLDKEVQVRVAPKPNRHIYLDGTLVFVIGTETINSLVVGNKSVAFEGAIHLNNEKTLDDCGVWSWSNLVRYKDQVFFTFSYEKQALPFIPEADIVSVKKAIQIKIGTRVEDQKLVLAGKQLDNGKTLLDYKVEKETTILLERRGVPIYASYIPRMGTMVHTDSLISCTFSTSIGYYEWVEVTSKNAPNTKLHGTVIFNFTFATQTLVFVPQCSLKPGTKYKVTVKARGIKSGMVDMTWTFTTTSSNKKLQVKCFGTKKNFEMDYKLGHNPFPALLLQTSEITKIPLTEISSIEGTCFKISDGDYVRQLQDGDILVVKTYDDTKEEKSEKETKISAEETFALLRDKAKIGIPAAQYELAVMLKKGIACTKNKKEAKEMILASAAQDYPEALNKVAGWHLKGKGCPKDVKKAAEMYYKSALQDNPEGLFHFAKLMSKGIGCEKDKQKAFGMLKKSAAKEFIPAMFTLGTYYEKGKICKKDTKQAFELYLKTAQEKHTQGMFRVALCYKNGIGCEQDNEKYLTWLKLSQKSSPTEFSSPELFETKMKGDQAELAVPKEPPLPDINDMNVDDLVAEILQMEDAEEFIDEIISSSAKLLMTRGKESVTKGDLTAAKAYYEVAKHAGTKTLTAKEQEKLQTAIARIHTINRVEKEKKEKIKEDKEGNRRKMISEMQELRKEKVKLQKEQKILEEKMKEVEKKEKELNYWAQKFEEKSKSWAEGGALSRELFVSSLTRFDE